MSVAMTIPWSYLSAMIAPPVTMGLVTWPMGRSSDCICVIIFKYFLNGPKELFYTLTSGLIFLLWTEGPRGDTAAIKAISTSPSKLEARLPKRTTLGVSTNNATISRWHPPNLIEYNCLFSSILPPGSPKKLRCSTRLSLRRPIK